MDATVEKQDDERVGECGWLWALVSFAGYFQSRSLEYHGDYYGDFLCYLCNFLRHIWVMRVSHLKPDS